jgi:sugar transferase (PEP-CTERM system associated)
VALVASECLLIIGGVALGAWLRLGPPPWVLLTAPHGLLKAFFIALVCQVCLYYADLYDMSVVSDRRELFVRIVNALGATSLLLAAIYFAFPSLVVGRGVFLFAAVFVISGVVGWRLAFEWLMRHASPRERLLLVGTGPAAVELARELFERRQALGVDIVGFIDPDPARLGATVINPGVIGSVEDIPTLVRALAVDRVVVSLADARGQLPMDKLLEMKLDGVNFDHLTSVYEAYTGKIAIENLRPSWLIFSSGFRKTRVLSAVKRALDLTAASIGLVLAAPLMALVALAVKCTSHGAVLYRQQRVGQHGRLFTLCKFRSMCEGAEAGTGAVWAKANDDRVTPVGRVIRKTRLDELPQLWNVLKGDMSFVGPRPERPEFVVSLTREIAFYGQRHAVKPGLTGWAQVSYPYGASVHDAMEKLQYDLFYIKNMSPALDLFIILKTIKTVLLRRGAQ